MRTATLNTGVDNSRATCATALAALGILAVIVTGCTRTIPAEVIDVAATDRAPEGTELCPHLGSVRWNPDDSYIEITIASAVDVEAMCDEMDLRHVNSRMFACSRGRASQELFFGPVFKGPGGAKNDESVGGEFRYRILVPRSLGVLEDRAAGGVDFPRELEFAERDGLCVKFRGYKPYWRGASTPVLPVPLVIRDDRVEVDTESE